MTTIPEGHFGNLTPTQQNALSQFAPQVLAKAEENSLTSEDLIIWNVDLSDSTMKSGQPQKRQAVVLLKFLRARKFDVAEALAMIIKCLKWRKDFRVTTIKDEKFTKSLQEGGLIHGRDTRGCPVTFNFYGKMDFEEIFSVDDGVDKFVRWRVQLQERAIELLDFEGGIEYIMQIHEYAGASMFKMDARMKTATKTIISLFQDNYPEMLSTKLFLSVPRVMEVLFNLMSSFSDAATRRKFRMVGPGNSRAALLEFIKPEQLPAVYGGFDAAPTVSDGDEALSRIQQGELRLKAGTPQEVSVDLGKGGRVLWNYVTRRDGVAVQARVLPSGTADGDAGRSVDSPKAGAEGEECGGGKVDDAPAGGRLVLRFEGRGKGMLWKSDVEVLYAVRSQ